MKRFKSFIKEDVDDLGKYTWGSDDLIPSFTSASGGSGLYEENDKWAGIEDHREQYTRSMKIHNKSPITADEHRSTEYYGRNGHAHINNHLRGKRTISNLLIGKDTLEDHKNNIDSIVNKHSLNHNTHLWRGMRNSAIRKFKVGKDNHVLHDKGFVSTSLNPSVARDFSSPNDKNHHLIHIKVPKGSKALYMNKHGTGNHEYNEDEVLLPRDSKFKYSHSTKDDLNNIHVHHYDYIAPESK